MIAAFLSVGSALLFAAIFWMSDRRSDSVVVKSSLPPPAAAACLYRAAREMGAGIQQVGDRQDAPETVTVWLHGKEQDGIWVVQASVKRTLRGSSIRLAALSLGQLAQNSRPCGSSRNRRDALALRLRD